MTVGDCGSAMGAEGCGWVDGAAAVGTVRGCRGRFAVRDRTGEDLIGDVERQSSVVLADAAGHEEAFDNTQDCGDAGPEEDEIDDAGSVSAEVKVVNTEVAKEEREEKADNLVLVGAFVLGVKPGALLVGHAGGVERVGHLHDVFLMMLRG